MRGVVNPRARSNGSHNLKQRLKCIISAAQLVEKVQLVLGFFAFV